MIVCYIGLKKTTFLSVIMPKHLSILYVILLLILYIVLPSCVGTSNWLSSPASSQNDPLDMYDHFVPLQIGISTKQEIIARFGHPTDRQTHAIDGMHVESLGYATAETTITPYQYIPLLGSVAFWSPLTHQAPSAAMSFSSEDVFSGLTVSTINAYGDIPSSEFFPIAHSNTSFYGMSNPDVSHTPAASNPQSP